MSELDVLENERERVSRKHKKIRKIKHLFMFILYYSFSSEIILSSLFYKQKLVLFISLWIIGIILSITSFLFFFNLVLRRRLYELFLSPAKVKSFRKHYIKYLIKSIKIFKINEYITLKLIGSKTKIFVDKKEFLQCHFILLNLEKKRSYKGIKSIDDAVNKLDKRLELDFLGEKKKELGITPEVEFQAHCSNLQAWYENDYDTRLLHSNLAFPLLKKLADLGDKKALFSLKEEIAMRFNEGNDDVRRFLIHEGYLNYLNSEQRDILLKDFKFELIKIKDLYSHSTERIYNDTFTLIDYVTGEDVSDFVDDDFEMWVPVPNLHIGENWVISEGDFTKREKRKIKKKSE